jgi:hypothetical protein
MRCIRPQIRSTLAGEAKVSLLREIDAYTRARSAREASGGSLSAALETVIWSRTATARSPPMCGRWCASMST